jgi:hypothetical protein
LLSQLGPQTAQFSTDIYNAAQRRYQQGVLEEAQRKQTLAEKLATAEEERKAAEAKFTQDLRDQQQSALQRAQEMAISMGTPTQVRETPEGEWETQAAPTREQLAVQLAQAGGPSAIPGVIQALTKDAKQREFKLQTGRDGFIYKVFEDGSPAERVTTAGGAPLAARTNAAELSQTQFRLLDEQQATIDSAQLALDNLARAAELSKTASYGFGAFKIAEAADKFGYANAAQRDLIELNNQIQRNVLTQLKSTFGGSPTEAEGNALREVEGSVDASPEVRARAIANAVKLAERRIRLAQSRMENIRTGYAGGTAKTQTVDDLMNEGS